MHGHTEGGTSIAPSPRARLGVAILIAAFVGLVACAWSVARIDAHAASGEAAAGSQVPAEVDLLAKPAGGTGLIAFVRAAGGPEHIYTITPAGKRLKRLTSGGNLDFAPAWSPDGDQLAFTRIDHLGNMNIFTIPRGGGDPTQVTHAAPGIASGVATWSPNGRRIAFTRGPFSGRAPGNIFRMRLDGSGLVRLTNSRRADETGAAWAPRGRRIAFVRGEPPHSSIWTMRPDGSAKRRLTRRNSGAENPSWSPNGKWIVYDRSTTRGSAIHLMRANGKRRRRITGRRGIRINPSFSPSGRRIVFAGGQTRTQLSLYTITRRGTDIRRVTKGRIESSQPAWKP